MKYLEKNKKRTALTVVAGVVCVLVIFAAGILVGQKMDSKKSAEAPTHNTEAASTETKISVTPEENTATPAPLPEDGNFGIDTPYCELRYPLKWQTYVDFEMQEADGIYTVEVYGLASDNRYRLFDVMFGSEGGYVLGHIDTGSQEIVVSLEMYDIPADAMMTEEERFELNMMCEDVNVIISKLMAQPGFTAQG